MILQELSLLQNVTNHELEKPMILIQLVILNDFMKWNPQKLEKLIENSIVYNWTRPKQLSKD